MDTALFRKIANYKTNKDVTIVNRWISVARFNALKSRGYVRYLLHREANHLERMLELALDKNKRRI